MTVKALVDLGSTDEAEGFLRWLGRILNQAPGPEWLHPLYSVTGNSMASEATIESLPGYAGSRPVRIGNAETTKCSWTSSAPSPSSSTP